MAAPAHARQPRRGPAPIASFDHDGSDESSPESKLTAARLPEIREDGARTSPGESLAPPEQRARSHSTPGGALTTPAPRIDISRASSSSHHDSRDSSPELALFAGSGGNNLDLGFREDGTLELRSSTEELAFLEPAPGERDLPPPRPTSAAPTVAAPPPPPPPPTERRHSRKDSQSSEAALLGVSGRTSRLSSVGSQCSALSRVSRLSVVSAASRSPSPHRMLLETSFCGPKPIETDPEISAGALVDQILGLVNDVPPPQLTTSAVSPPEPLPAVPVDARDHREVRTEVTVESARTAPVTAAVTVFVPPAPANTVPVSDDKNDKEMKDRSITEERRARPRLRREPSEPEVYKSKNKSKDIIRIKLKPDDSCEEEEEESREEAARKPATLELGVAARPAAPPPAAVSPTPSRRRSPSPANPPVSRKSSFCSLFKSRETIASPESPSEALRRKRSLTEGRSRSKSRDRSATPTSGNKIRGSVLSLFRTPRRSAGAEPSPTSRDGSPVVQNARPLPAPPPDRRKLNNLKYYEDSKDGIIHIPLRTPPDEHGSAAPRRSSGAEPVHSTAAPQRDPRPASAPQPRAMLDRSVEVDPHPRPAPAGPGHAQAEPHPPSALRSSKPIHRTVLPDGSIIIPLHSPTEIAPEVEFSEMPRAREAELPAEPVVEAQPIACEAPAPSPGAHPPAAASCSPDGPAAGEEARCRRKERLVFTTQVGSREQVFSTQFSITKTPSVTSEISGSFPSFDGEREPVLRDSHIAEPAALPDAPPTPPPQDSSESEPSSEAAPSHAGNDVEKRVLVVAQESFEEELPYVPTTLPQERSVALPMVPVRERGGVRVSSVQRPRAAAPPAAPPAAPSAAPPAAPSAAPPAAADKLRIKLPRRPRARTRSPPDTSAAGGEPRPNSEWIDFEEVPERRKQPKRIQTLPAAAAGGAPLLFNYVDPEHCRCECHARPDTEDQLPLLPDDMRASIISSSSAECGEPDTPAPAAPPGPPPAPGALPS